jgi:hypothetical protein
MNRIANGKNSGETVTASSPMGPTGRAFSEKSPHSLFDVFGLLQLAAVNLLRTSQRFGKTRKFGRHVGPYIDAALKSN